MKNKFSIKAFTLVELLVVIAIIGILAGIVTLQMGGFQKKSRDNRRRADLSAVQAALEQYKYVSGGYPSSIVPPATTPSVFDSCSRPSSWVPGIQPTYVASLPADPKKNDTSFCYQYKSDGIEYKLFAKTEFPPVPSTDQMYYSTDTTRFAIITPGAATVTW